MALTDQEYQSWLDDGTAIRCILVEATARVSGVETLRKMSSMVTVDPTYDPIVLGSSVEISSRISIDGNSSISFGDIEIDNSNGVRDSWLNDIWAKRDVVVKLGAPTWPIDDYRIQFSGLVDDIDSRDTQVLNFKIRDAMEKLNTPISDVKLGGSTTNSDELIPLCFGEVHNVKPLLINPATLQYQVHVGQIERIIEVRANGVPVPFTPNLSNGTFTLDNNPHNQKITCSVQGDRVGSYHRTIADIIEEIVTRFGEPANRLTSGDIDTANFAAFDASNQQTVGVYITNGENVRRVCNELANSVGAQIAMDALGNLKIHQIALPAAGAPVIVEADFARGGNTYGEEDLQIIERLTAQSTQKIKYNRNYVVQQALETGVIQEHKDLFEREWLTVTSVNSTIKTQYRQQEEPESIETNLQNTSEAQSEVDRRRQLYDQTRHIYSKECTPSLIQTQVGQAVTVFSHRYGLTSGANGMVLGTIKRIEDLSITLEMFV